MRYTLSQLEDDRYNIYEGEKITPIGNIVSSQARDIFHRANAYDALVGQLESWQDAIYRYNAKTGDGGSRLALELKKCAALLASLTSPGLKPKETK